MADSSKDDLKKLIREAVQEVVNDLQAEASSSQSNAISVPKEKGKSGSKNKSQVVFDRTRTMTPTSQDPRSDPSQWPCMGQHEIKAYNNKWGEWKECAVCNLRVAYTPAQGAPATSCKTDHGPNVISALERLRADGWTKETLQPHTVKSMVKVIANENVVKNKPKAAGKTKAQKKKAEDAGMISDDSFEKVPKEEKGDKK